MVNESLGPPLDRYAAVLGKHRVFNAKFADKIQELSKVDWNSSAAIGGRLILNYYNEFSSLEVGEVYTVVGCSSVPPH